MTEVRWIILAAWVAVLVAVASGLLWWSLFATAYAILAGFAGLLVGYAVMVSVMLWREHAPDESGS